MSPMRLLATGPLHLKASGRTGPETKCGPRWGPHSTRSGMRLGEDLGLLRCEFLFAENTFVLEVGELGQLVG